MSYLDFKVTPLFDTDYLKTSTTTRGRSRHRYNGFAHGHKGVTDLEWSWVI